MKYLLLILVLFRLLEVPAQENPEKSTVIGSPLTNEWSANIVSDASQNTYTGGIMTDKTLIIKQNALHQTIWSKLISFPLTTNSTASLAFLDLVGDTLFGCGDIEQSSQAKGTFYFKMNAQTGAIYWSKYELTSQGYLSSIRYSNGKFFLVGGTIISSSLSHGKVIAVSSQTGDMIWQTPLLKFNYPIAGNSNRTYFTSSTEMRHGKMYITGYHINNSSTVTYPTMPLLVGVSESGTVFLQKRIPLPFIPGGVNTSFQGGRIEYDMDDHIVLANFNTGVGTPLNDPNLVVTKFDTLGNTLFSREYEIDLDGWTHVHGLNETNTSYVLCGTIQSNFTGLYTLKTDKSGNPEKCVGIQKPNIWYIGASSQNSYGNSDFKNGKHYFAVGETNISNPTVENNINQIILDEGLNTISDCSELSELEVSSINLNTSLEALELVTIPNTFTYQEGISIDDLDLYIPCDSISLQLEQVLGCQTIITANVSGFEGPIFHWPDGTNAISNTYIPSSTDTVIVRVTDIRCCELIDTIVPIPNHHLTVTLPVDTFVCLLPGASFTITATVNNVNGPLSLVWNTNSTGNSLSVNESGTYWIEASDTCHTVRDSIEITVLGLPEITNLTDTAICEGTFPVTLNPLLANAVSVLWENGTTSINRDITGPGTYTLQVTNSCGTIDTTIQVSQTELPEVSLGATIDSCLSNGQNILLVPVLNHVSSVSWSNGTSGNQLAISQSGIYTVFGSNSCGMDSASCSAIIREFPQLFLPSVLDTCFEIGVGFAYTAFGSPGTYQWSSGSQTATEWISQEGLYSCTLSNQCGTVTDSMKVNRLAALSLFFPSDSLSVCETAISQGMLQIESNYLYELFLPWSGHPANSTLTESGWYQIRAFNSCGELWDSIYIDLQNEVALYVPNSFTPNNDGINDELIVTEMNARITELSMFNRWGEEVYQVNKNIHWDGNYKGLPCPDGIYLVRIVYENCFGIPTEFTGHVNLLR